MLLDLDLIKSRLEGKTFISRIIYFDEIASTNDYAKKTEVEDNTLIISEFQTSGKGRQNRKWESNKGENLTFTIKKKFDTENKWIQSVNFYFSYFLLVAIEKYLTENQNSKNIAQLEIKWPNDIIIDNKKLSGLLVECEKDRNFIIGIGLNVNQERFDHEYDFKSTSLIKVSGNPVDRANLLINIIQTFNDNLRILSKKQYEKLHKLWTSKCKIIGKKVNFTYPNNVTDSGYVVSVLTDGGIALKIANNDKVFYSGDISIKNN